MRLRAAFAAAVLVACGGGASSTDPSQVEADPAEPGPWSIGVTTVDVADPDTPSRVLSVEIWYPALVSDGDERELVLGVESDSVREAPPDRRGAPFPLIAFSHGNGGMRFQSIYLTQHLASHGYVVVAPDHPHNTLSDDDPDRRSEVLRNRPRDVRIAIDTALAKSIDPGDPLANLIDAARIGVSGHSFGGFTALLVGGARMDLDALAASCAADPDSIGCDGLDATITDEVVAGFADPRVAATLALAPAGRVAFGPDGLAAVATPIQVQGGTLDTIATPVGEIDPIFAGLPPSSTLAMLDRAAHFSFTDICPLYELLGGETGTLGFLATEGCGANTLAIERAHAASRTLATAFFDLHLKGRVDERGYLDPAVGVPDAAITAR